MSSFRKKVASSSTTTTTANAIENGPSRSYTVLYYKRKNKVHKSKGVSKMDGYLTVEAPPKSVVTLSEDVDKKKVVFRGIQREIANKGELEVDDTIQIGSFEAEILSMDHDSSSSSSSKVAAAAAATTTNTTTSSSTSSSSLAVRPTSKLLRPPNRNLFRPVMVHKASTTVPKRSLYKQPPPQPTKKKSPPTTISNSEKIYALSDNDNDNDDDSSSDDEDGNAIVAPRPLHAPQNHSKPPAATTGGMRKRPFVSPKSSSSSSSLLAASKFPRKTSAFTRLNNNSNNKQQPLRSTTATTTMTSSSTKNRTIIGRRLGAKTSSKSSTLSSSSSSPPTTTTTTTTSTSSSSPSLFFPGAVGTVDVPHSIKTVLRPHQIEGVAFLWNCLTGHTNAAQVSPHSCIDDEDNNNNNDMKKKKYTGAILADEMGLGKTLMTIAVTCALHRRNRSARFVIVCPSSLVVNWEKEFDKWLGKASNPKRVVVKKGGNEGLQRLKAFCAVKSGQSEVLIISYDLFRRNATLFETVKKIALLVVDEGHRLKNTAGSLTLTALESIPCDARLCITATPIQNNLSDFFNIANFVCPGLLGDLATFRKEYERPITSMNNKSCTEKQRRLGKEQSRILDSITKTFMIRRLQKDTLNRILPPRTEVLVFCRPTELQCRLYRDMTRQLSPVSGATADALTTLINLRKLCSHPSLVDGKGYNNNTDNDDDNDDDDDDDTKDVGISASGKLKTLDILLTQMRKEAPKDKVVIVSNFTTALSTIEDTILKPRGLSFVRLDGTTEISSRQQIVDTFNKTSSERSFAFLLSSKAGGCGLNLIGANRLVMFDPDWNPASDVQAMARIYRQGQAKPCTIFRLFTSGTVEEVICQRQMQKGNLATIAVDSAGKNADKKRAGTGFTKEELRDCFTLKEGCDCDTKVKVGNKWPAYDGFASIIAEGCVDKPLIATLSEAKSPISFVHVVKNAADKPAPTCDDDDDDNGDFDNESSADNDNNNNDSRENGGDAGDTSEEEHQWTDDSNEDDDDAEMAESSDDENEFE